MNSVFWPENPKETIWKVHNYNYQNENNLTSYVSFSFLQISAIVKVIIHFSDNLCWFIHYNYCCCCYYSGAVLNVWDLYNFILGLDGVPFILNPSLQNLSHGHTVSVWYVFFVYVVMSAHILFQLCLADSQK